jgi:hypothetical protein
MFSPVNHGSPGVTIRTVLKNLRTHIRPVIAFDLMIGLIDL